MTTAYTSLLGLALPVTGELDGTWGDVVNNYITSYVDASVAGAQTISGSQTAVTLSTTNGSSLSQAGSGSTGSAQYQIINCTGNPATTLTITAPATSKTYIVINQTSTSQSVVLRGSGPTTGVTIASGDKALVAWNGSDFVRVGGDVVGPASATDNAVAIFDGTTGKLLKNGVAPGTNGNVLTSNGTTWTSAALPVTLDGVQTLTNKTLSTGTTLGAQVTGGDFILTRTMFQDTGWDYYDSNTTSALNYVNGSVQRWAPSGTVSLTLSNWPPSGNLGELLIEGINLGAATITWPTINWITITGATTTTFASNGVILQTSGTDWVFLWTRDGGTTIYGKVVR